MNHLTRRIIFWSFVVIFFLLTSYFFLLVNSYVVSFSSLKDPKSFISLQKTGILAVDSNPRGANISLERKFKSFLNKDIEVRQEIVTPYKVKNLIPGEYTLRVKLDGYWDFEKNIEIISGQTVYMEDISLFKKTLPLLISSREAQEIEINKDFSTIMFLDDKELFDVQKEESISISENVNKLNFLGSNKVLINNSIIFDYKKNDYLFLENSFYSGIENIKYSGNNFYFLKDNKSLFSYNLDNNTHKLLLEDSKIDDYYIYNDFVYLISTIDSQKFFKVYSIEDGVLEREVEMSSNSNFKIQSVIGPYALLYDEKFSSLSIVEPFSKINFFRKQIKDVKNINIVDGNSFIYSNDFEIYMFDLNLSQSFLVSRLENQIGSILWHPRSYLIFSSGRDIKAIDFKYDKQVLNLFSSDSFSNIILDREGGALYFTSKIGRQEGLFKLYIQ
jgi:hypothetical protein